MSDEYFFGITLKGAKAQEIWDPEARYDSGEYSGAHKLVVKQVLLDADATDDVHVVQVEAMSWKEQISIPIANLYKKGLNQLSLDLAFPDTPVTFKLIKGTGPVYVLGHHLMGAAEEYDDMDMEEAMLDEDEEGAEDGLEEEEEDGAQPKAKKPKVSNSGGKASASPTKGNARANNANSKGAPSKK